jgi:3-deoxy-D-manno-octulosonate 8-phosphate phosphatase (KDO 8-P phosphatase)
MSTAKYQAALKLAADVKLLVLDVDGVLTNGELQFDYIGREMKTFHARDGFGIRQLIRAGIPVAVISGRSSIAVEARMQELGIQHVFLAEEKKLQRLIELTGTLKFNLNQVAYVGDDIPDMECMRSVGLAIGVADAHREIQEMAHWCTELGGGKGAVREACDLILAAQNRESVN